MNIRNWLINAEKTLIDTSGTARLDTEVLLADALDKDKSWLYAHPDQEIEATTLKKLNSQLKRRVLHEPLAYIRGKSEFYGREFLVDKRVLVPRPETETLIALAIEQVIGYRLKIKDKITIVDVGTGSGALAITAKLELPYSEVIATDIDSKCIKLAQRNARKHKANIKFLEGDLLAPFSNLQPITYNLVVLANLPYVPTNYPINQAAAHEPKLAIFGGPDGLDLYRQLFNQLSKFTVDSQQLTVFTESLNFQHKELNKIAKKAGFKQIAVRDLIQVFTIT